MNGRERALLDWAPKGLEAMLESFAARAKAIKAGSDAHRPLVTVHLESGRDLTGFVLDLSNERPTRLLLLHIPGPERAPNYDVAHVPLARVEAVTVHDVPTVDDLPGEPPEAPSPLNIRRRLAELQGELEKLLGVKVPFEVETSLEANLTTVGHAIEVLGKTVLEQAHDDLGKQALAALTKIRVVIGDFRVTKEGTVLTVATPATWGKRLLAEPLKTALEAAL